MCCLITKSSLDAATTEGIAPGLGTCLTQITMDPLMTTYLIDNNSSFGGFYIGSWTLAGRLEGVGTAISMQGVRVSSQEVDWLLRGFGLLCQEVDRLGSFRLLWGWHKHGILQQQLVK